MRFFLPPRVFAVLLLIGPRQPLWAESDQKQDTVNLPGIDPLPSQEAAMGQEQLENFFTHQKRGTPLQLTLDKGKVIKGLFSSYDDYYETVWLVPQGQQGVFTQKGYKLAGIRHVALWDKKGSSPKGNPSPEGLGSDDYYLMKESGIK